MNTSEGRGAGFDDDVNSKRSVALGGSSGLFDLAGDKGHSSDGAVAFKIELDGSEGQ